MFDSSRTTTSFPVVVDSTPMDLAMIQLKNEVKDALRLDEEELAKVDHIEFCVRLNPEICVKVFPKND